MTNTGACKDCETVLLFVRDVVSSVTTPVKRLRRFARVELAPGESKQVSFTLYAQGMSYIGTGDKPVLEPGLFEVMAGGLTGQFRLV